MTEPEMGSTRLAPRRRRPASTPSPCSRTRPPATSAPCQSSGRRVKSHAPCSTADCSTKAPRRRTTPPRRPAPARRWLQCTRIRRTGATRRPRPRDTRCPEACPRRIPGCLCSRRSPLRIPASRRNGAPAPWPPHRVPVGRIPKSPPRRAISIATRHLREPERRRPFPSLASASSPIFFVDDVLIKFSTSLSKLGSLLLEMEMS